jgi:hypothetical protein
MAMAAAILRPLLIDYPIKPFINVIACSALLPKACWFMLQC